MKKRFLLFVLVLSLCAACGLTQVVALESQTTKYDADIKSVVTAYLEDSVRSVYFYDPQNIEKYTIASLPESEVKDAANEIALQRESARLPYYADESLTGNGLPSLLANLRLHQDMLTYFGHVYKTEEVTYSWFKQNCVFSSIKVSGDTAVVEMYKTLDYQYSNCKEPTFELIQYYIALTSVAGKWYIASVESDNDFFQTYKGIGFDLQSEIAGFDKAWNLPENVSARSAAASEIAAENSDITAAATNISYNRQNAANYALTYSTQTDNGQYPTYKNTYFAWAANPCMLFASQCVWAGFGGSNTQADINAKQGMDNDGTNDSYKWWSTGSGSTGSWNSCSNFRQYVINIRSSTDSGLYCNTLYVESDQESLYGVPNVLVPLVSHAQVNLPPYNGHYSVPGDKSSPFSASTIRGAVLHVNSTEYILGHAMIINNATGITRGQIYVTAYNYCRRNMQLSLLNPVGSMQDLYVTAPQYFRNGQTSTRLYAKLENSIGAGTTLSLTGYSTSSVPTLTMSIYAPGASTPTATAVSHNSTSVTKSFAFSSTGTWKITISSPGLQTFTYVVRVV